MPSKVFMQFMDYATELSSSTMWSYDIDDGNIDAWYVAVDALIVAIDAITLGAIARHDSYISIETYAAGVILPGAQRENAWRFVYSDDTTHDEHSVLVATADLQLLSGNTDQVNFSNAFMLAFKNAFEALCVDPFTGNTVSLDAGSYVGRNR